MKSMNRAAVKRKSSELDAEDYQPVVTGDQSSQLEPARKQQSSPYIGVTKVMKGQVAEELHENLGSPSTKQTQLMISHHAYLGDILVLHPRKL
jgi:hypothetical protein